MSTLGKKLKVYLNFPSFRLTCFSCSFAKIKEVKYSLSFTLRYSFHSSRGTQKCPNPLLLHSCFFPKFSTLMQTESAVEMVALSSCVMCLQSRPCLCGTMLPSSHWQFEYKAGFISFCARMVLSDQSAKPRRGNDDQ